MNVFGNNYADEVIELNDRSFVVEEDSDTETDFDDVLSGMPITRAESLVPHGCRAVIVAPHPDDEIISCGGLMAQLKHLGRDMTLIAVTDGDASHPESSLWPRTRLMHERPRETQMALKQMHIGGLDTIRIGLGDGKVHSHTSWLSSFIAAQLQPNDVVFSTWRLDGHPDHDAVGYASHHAANAAGVKHVEMPVWCWHWASPGDKRIPWNRARQLPIGDTLLRRKNRAMQSFKSQIEPDPSTGSAPVLPAQALRKLIRPSEIYFV